MFQQLLPPDSGESGAVDALPDAAAGLAGAEPAQVDDALLAMALAHGPEQLPAMVAMLEPSTRAALYRRWKHCASQWNAMRPDAVPDLFPWTPAQKPDVWRAVLIAMVEAEARANHARHVLWPSRFDGM